MSNPTPRDNLINILAELFIGVNSLRIASSANLKQWYLVDERPIDVWTKLLTEAEEQNKVDLLLAAVLSDSPENEELHRAVNAYRASVEQDGDSESKQRNQTQPVTSNHYSEEKAAPIAHKLPDSREEKGADANPPIQPDLPNTQLDVFISYSRLDAEVMRRLRADLRAAGLTIWTDDVELEPGTSSWMRAIEEAIHAARCMIVLLSPEAKKSKWVEIEVSLAEDLGLRIFPLLIRGEERNAVLFRLLTTQRIDLRTNYQTAVTEQLVPALQRHLRAAKPRGESTSEITKTPKLSQPMRTPSLRRFTMLDLGITVIVVLFIVIVISAQVYLQDLFTLSSVATPTLTGFAIGSTATQVATVKQMANLRAGPASSSPIVGKILAGQQVKIEAIDASGGWFLLEDGTWIATFLVDNAPTHIPVASLQKTASITSTETITSVGLTPTVIGLTPTVISSKLVPTVTPLPPTPQAVVTHTNPRDGAVYVWIPPGEFMMGSNITDTLAFPDERPQHRVVLDGFWIMQTEVTNAHYKRCVEAKVCTEPAKNTWWNNSTYANHPVVNITWEDAKIYAAWVGGRLPTEAEWEYACRGSDGRIYPWGNKAPNAQLLNYRENNKKDRMPVGSYSPEASGLYDMAGNVAEWTADWYDKNYYAESRASKPKGPDNGSYHTLRGGSFSDDVKLVRCPARSYDPPDNGDFDVGFRVASDGF